MTKRYAIWDKVSPVITPAGEYCTPEEWFERYPAARHITYVCQTGEINGGYFESLTQMKIAYGMAGVDFSKCATNEECLEVIEAFEDERMAAAAAAAAQPTSEERTATALEAIASGQTTENVAAMNALLSGEE